MDRRPTINMYIKIISIPLLTILMLSNIVAFFLFNFVNENKSLDYSFTIAHFKINYIFQAISLILFCLLLSLIKKIKFEVQTMEQSYLEEIENKDKMIKDLSELYNKAVNSNNLKTEFFYNISHDLKTPISVILGAIQLIDQSYSITTVDRRNSHRHNLTIKQNCYRLLRLINNILELSRIESGYLKLNAFNCNIVYLVEEITQSVIPYARQKGIMLEFDTDTEEIMTAVDIDKIERIMLNLLSNAIKFTSSGGKISVVLKEKRDKVLIIVMDTGIGIPNDMVNKIFERYKQVDNSLTQRTEGSGIGLSLVKSFVDIHQGTIAVKSFQNKGSEFRIELPVRTCKSCPHKDNISKNNHNRIIEAINIEFSDIYSSSQLSCNSSDVLP